MAKTFPPNHYRPTKAYWHELAQADHRIFSAARYRPGSRWPWLQEERRDHWARIDEHDDASTIDDRRITVAWTGRQRHGGRINRTVLRLSRLVLDGPIQGQPNIPAVERIFVYNYGSRRAGSFALMYTTSYELRGMEKSEPDPSIVRPTFDKGALDAAFDHGLMFPSMDEYDELLEEVRYGASGRGRYLESDD